jgi:cytochrome c5
MKIKISISLLILLLVGCAQELVLPEASNAAVSRVSEKFPGVTIEQLAQGKVLYAENCGKCHKLYAPASKLDDYWEGITPPMAKRAKLSADQEKLVLQYLVAMSKQ